MPEGDTVWLSAKRMHDALAGATLTGSDFRVPKLATVDLGGRQVREVVARGKHMLTRIEGDVTLHTHFRMEGSWRLHRPGARWQTPAHHVRVVLTTADWQAVGYRLPVVELVPTTAEERIVGHLGPDLLGPDWDADEAVRRLRMQPDRAIGEALLDQRNLAGIGNLYRAEVLFLSGVSPWTAVADVARLDRVVDLSHRLLVANRSRWDQITTGNTRRGEQQWVFERTGRPCRRCGEPIRSTLQGEPPYDRICYWCPRCQAGVETPSDPAG
ncbi:MAG TPA: DNA-formamidopyrimidine glycosylase family protein [Mycobacteriales bacterium]|nr:DNA-formamidopyrimidine glycosylase family protein [Mycobacteriales bacterium]